jgi:hypothetical protein
MTLEDKVQAQWLGLFRRAAEFGNVRAACREAGMARSLDYALKGHLERFEPEGLHSKHRQGRLEGSSA